MRRYHLSSLTASTLPSMTTAWVADAGLLLPVTLAHHLGLGELVDNHMTWEMRRAEPTRP